MGSAYEVTQKAMDSYTDKAENAKSVSFISLALGSTCTGMAVIFGLQGADINTGLLGAGAALSYGLATGEIVIFAATQRRATELEGVLAQHDLATEATPVPETID